MFAGVPGLSITDKPPGHPESVRSLLVIWRKENRKDGNGKVAMHMEMR